MARFHLEITQIFKVSHIQIDIFPLMFAVPMNPGAESKDYSALRRCGNCNLTAESPQISTRQPHIPDEAIRTLCAECATQEVLKKVLMAFCTGLIKIKEEGWTGLSKGWYGCLEGSPEGEARGNFQGAALPARGKPHLSRLFYLYLHSI